MLYTFSVDSSVLEKGIPLRFVKGISFVSLGKTMNLRENAIAIPSLTSFERERGRVFRRILVRNGRGEMFLDIPFAEEKRERECLLFIKGGTGKTFSPSSPIPHGPILEAWGDEGELYSLPEGYSLWITGGIELKNEGGSIKIFSRDLPPGSPSPSPPQPSPSKKGAKILPLKKQG